MTVCLVVTHVQTPGAVGGAPGTVTHTGGAGLDQWELVRVHDRVDRLEADVAHLHQTTGPSRLRPEPENGMTSLLSRDITRYRSSSICWWEEGILMAKIKKMPHVNDPPVAQGLP